jgi:hypothetical protein
VLWGTKDVKNVTLVHTVHFHVQHCLYLTHFLNLPYLYQTKNHQIPQRIYNFHLLCLKLWIYPFLSADPSLLVTWRCHFYRCRPKSVQCYK